MSRREAWLSAGLVFLVALAVRAAAALPIVFPKPEDTAYYVGVARNLVEGRGLVSDAIWSYQTPPLVFPRPAFEVWLPLSTLLAALPMALFGPSFRAAQAMSVLVGALVPVLAWRLGADVAAERALPAGRARTLALGTGLTSAVYLPLVLHSTLPDSTMLFAVLALGACLLMTRLARDPREGRPRDPRLLGLGVLFGLAALTRNEVAWLALVWVAGALSVQGVSLVVRLRLVAVPGVVALAVFAPWAWRDWSVFGSPFPGQAAANALSVSGFDIFAWSDPPTLSRYLAQGPGFLLSSRVEGLGHNLFNVLLFLGIPVAVIGLVALPWTARCRALRPLVLFSATTLAITSVAFPVATTWGTFLHAAGPVHVLLVASCLLALDRLIVAVGRRRGWTRPVAWLGPALTVSASLLFTAVLMPGFGSGSGDTERTYRVLAAELAAAGRPAASLGPVITDFPIWFGYAERAPALALPDEPPESVLSLARAFPGTRMLILTGDEHGRWPSVLDSAPRDPAAACFRRIALPAPPDPDDRAAIASVRVYEIACP